jgi:ribonuclease T2
LKHGVALVVLTLSVPAIGQENSCRIPAQLRVPDARKPYDEQARPVPVRGYTLVLSWSPQFCRTHSDDVQCDPGNGGFGFIIHGLWPEGEGSEAPTWCSAAPLTPDVVRAQFCAMPSPRLIAHEWAKHGSCATSNPAQYFAASRKLFGAVRFPDMNALSRRQIDVGAFKQLMATLNPAISTSSMVVEINGGWLQELRICLNVKLRPEACPRSRAYGARNNSRLRIWRI